MKLYKLLLRFPKKFPENKYTYLLPSSRHEICTSRIGHTFSAELTCSVIGAINGILIHLTTLF